MVKLSRCLNVLLSCLVLSACSAMKWGDDGQGDYSRSVALPPLQTEMGLVAPGSRNDRFQVPGEGGLKLNPDITVQTPKLPGGARLRIEKQGKLYWVASAHKPSVLWPHLKNFWRVNDYSLSNIDQRNGLLTTRWSDTRNIQLNNVQHEYRLRVIPYRTGSRTFITVRSRSMVNGKARMLGAAPKLELEILSKLQTYLSGL